MIGDRGMAFPRVHYSLLASHHLCRFYYLSFFQSMVALPLECTIPIIPTHLPISFYLLWSL